MHVDTAGNWEDDFVKSCQEQEFALPPSFEPPIYNVWKQQTKTNAVSHFGNSEARWVENLLYLYTNPASRFFDRQPVWVIQRPSLPLAGGFFNAYI